MTLTVVSDCETDGLDPDNLWCVVNKELGEKSYKSWDVTSGYDTFIDYAKTVDRWVFHNGISYDGPVLNKLLGSTVIDPFKIVDTFVVSRLVNYTGYNGHGLDEIGKSLGQAKTVFNDWEKFTPEMLSYCEDDVDLGTKIYRKYERYINDPAWAKSMETEHRMAMLCKKMHDNGFKFNLQLANEVLPQIKDRLDELDAEMQRAFPPALQEVHRIQYRTKADGSLYATTANAMDNYPKTTIDGAELVCFDMVSFNPGSHKNRIDKLWEAGWNPTEKSKAHYKFTLQGQVGEKWGKTKLTQEMYDTKKEEFGHYGWTVTDENLDTLPSSAPQGARDLAEWLCLNGRLKPLEERIRECESDGRIRTKFWHIGAWTHRMSHSSPNLANISSPFHGEAVTAVDLVKQRFDGKLRAMFTVDEGNYLVGTDAESIQLRILAHYLKNDDYVRAITEGRKEDATDIHNVNRAALGLDHLTRDHAKTFIYAWLLGAGSGKVARILGCTTKQAKGAVDSFVKRTEGLGKLKSGLIRRDAARGFFEGFDGRKVICPSEYLMLAGYLQNGEAVIMKRANWLWDKWCTEDGLNFKQVNFVHDEWQTEVTGTYEEAQRVGELQCKSLVTIGEELGLFCPMSGETNIGRTWLDTH
jgi:DNA polymerase-1